MTKMQKPGMIVTGVGVVGVFVSFVIQKGELDPTALGLSIASVFLAIMGISWMLGSPSEGARKRSLKPRHRRVKR